MANFKNYILPLGSVVKCNIIIEEKREELLFVIVNRFVLASNNKDATRYYEYEGLLFPGGTQKGERLHFNQENITEVIHKGYEDSREEEYLGAMNVMIIEKGFKKKKIRLSQINKEQK